MIDPNLFFDLDAYSHKDLWNGADYPWSALLFIKEYLSQKRDFQIEINIPSGVHLENPEMISIGERTILEPGVFIKGPCIIGKDCRIRHGAYLRDGVICGDGCAIGHCAEIKHSILLNFAQATHFVYVGDSILGNTVNLGAGVKCANLRLDRKSVAVCFEAVRIQTQLKKFGAIIGDGAQIGCNCVINPGTLIAKNTLSLPLKNLSGYITQPSEEFQTDAVGTKILEHLRSNKLRHNEY